MINTHLTIKSSVSIHVYDIGRVCKPCMAGNKTFILRNTHKTFHVCVLEILFFLFFFFFSKSSYLNSVQDFGISFSFEHLTKLGVPKMPIGVFNFTSLRRVIYTLQKSETE